MHVDAADPTPPPSSAREREAWLRLALWPSESRRKQCDRLSRHGSAAAALASIDAERTTGGDDARLEQHRVLEAALRWLERPGNHLITLGDALYPPLWLEAPDPPLAFFARGDAEVLQRRSVAIVGSRSCTPQGARDAHAFARALAQRGLGVVSGMALGIDTAAHLGALAAPGPTVAVWGTGPDVVYPRANAALAERIAADGCIVSEFPPGTPAIARNFPRRNRLISGLCGAVLVVEASEGSGSLITARCALDQNRDVLVVPGSIHSPQSKGCHALIRMGAMLVESAEHVLDAMGIAAPRSGQGVRASAPAHAILKAIAFAPQTADEVAASCGRDIVNVLAELAQLQVVGLVDALPGGRFQRRAGTSDPAL